jgi:O-antigen/teichoic acid export membrane protein
MEVSGRRIARNTTVQATADAIGKVASLAFYVVMARRLGQEQFGDFTFALSLVLLCTVFAGFGVAELIARTLAKDPSVGSRLLTDGIIAVGAFGALGAAAAVVVAAVADYDAVVVETTAVLAVAAVVELVSKIFYATFQGLEDMAPAATSLLIQRFFTAIVGIGVLLAGAGLVAAAAVYLAGALLAQAHAAFRLARRRIRPHRTISPAGARALVTASVTIGVTILLNTALFRIDATILSAIKGNAAVGIYGAAYRLLESTLFLSWAFVTALLPVMARLSRTSSPTLGEVYTVGFKLIAVVLLPLGAIFVAFAHPIVELIYTSAYLDAVSAVRWLGGAVALYGVSYLASHLLIAQSRPDALPWVNGIVLTVNVVLNLIVIPRWSYDGAAAVTSISEGMLAIGLVTLARRLTGPVPVVRIFAGPLVATGAIALVAYLAGTTLVVLPLAVAAYVVVLVAIEYRVLPADRRLLADLRR